MSKHEILPKQLTLRSGLPCAGLHDFVLDKKGHECRRCGLREEIIGGQKYVLDPRMPKGEIRLVHEGVTVGIVTGLE